MCVCVGEEGEGGAGRGWRLWTGAKRYLEKAYSIEHLMDVSRHLSFRIHFGVLINKFASRMRNRFLWE